MGYFSEGAKGVTWVGVFRVTTRGISFVRTIILARVLSPVQFGIFGIASLTITFLEILTETGINVVLVQQKEGIGKYLNTAWVVSILRGVAITVILVVSAPLVASYFNSPESKNLIYLIGFVSLIRGFINPSIVRYQKELRFKSEFLFRFSVFAFDSIVAIVAAFITKSAVGIVFGLVAGAILELILSFTVVKPRPKVEFNLGRLKEILSQGKWVTGAGIFQFLFKQGDDGVVGKILGESSLGTYQVAYKICSLPISEVADVFGRVTFPLYVKISEDKRRLKKAFLRTTGVISLLVLPMGAFIFLFGEQIVRLLLGEAWLSVVPLVKVLSVFGVVQSVSNSVNSFFLATKRQHIITMVTFVNIAGLLVSIFPLIHYRGLTGAAYAPLIGSLLGVPLVAWSVVRILKND